MKDAGAATGQMPYEPTRCECGELVTLHVINTKGQRAACSASTLRLPPIRRRTGGGDAMNPWADDEAGYDDWLDDLLSHVPDSWDGDEGAEVIVSSYLHELESRVLALGGSLERWPR